MSSTRLRLIGGPHHDKTGWYQDANDETPDVIYVTEQPHGQALIYADPHSPFAAGPYTRYHLTGMEPGKHLYTYLPEKP